MTLSPAPYIRWMQRAAQLLSQHEAELTELDARIGDADHGLNMRRGFQAVAELDPTQFDQAGAYLKKVGMTLVSKVGGASGPLYGTFFLRAGVALTQSENTAVSSAEACSDRDILISAFQAGLAGIKQRGKASTGEKTMVDAWEPALQAAQASTEDLGATLNAALQAAQLGAQKTIEMIATKGRASYLGERSQGTMDPGAASTCLILQAAKEAFTQ